MTIFEAQRRIAKIDLLEIAARTLTELESLVIALNQEQLSHGLRSDGEELYPDYRDKSYAAMKHRKNPKPGEGVPDLELTGSFYNKFYLDTDKFTVSSHDAKTEKLVEKYGRSIFGLSDDSLQKMKPEVIRRFKAKIDGILNGDGE
ncbi:MAG: hypothetical protein LBF89_11810 [Bacteroidales bacterium]|jgi:hypothetical protein|nr:hypothetical protein [Bacteroidales bacterium]